ncbi:MerR family transcriptional regulator [Alteromonadaceae bacterium M269]|nr:MerR family transcriptional regulator [Alteromonadaceae bacterium M269]
MKNRSEITVKEMALLSGVTIRTLHHYDDIGLLKAHRAASGYRVYNEKHALRLQQILLHKSFGLSLEDIAKTLDDPQFDNLANLKRQKKTLEQQAENMHLMIGAIDAAIEKLTCSKTIDLSSIFEGFDPALYDDEVEQRWGETSCYKECQDKMKNYTDEDWEQLKQQENAIWRDAAHALRAGTKPDSASAQEITNKYRKHIDRWFYTTSTSGFAALADLWENDPRFAKNIDKFEPGLAKWMAAAVRR